MIYKNARSRCLKSSFGIIDKITNQSADCKGSCTKIIMSIRLHNKNSADFSSVIPNIKGIKQLYFNDMCDTLLNTEVEPIHSIKKVNELLKGKPVIVFFTKNGSVKEISTGENRYFSYARFLENRKKIAKEEAKQNESLNRPEY
ncbi:MAG: hypothetical protein KBT30_02880 [Clostridiales bacterium]|nr:hypothetical protein [Candidatus Apopatousia equi]